MAIKNAPQPQQLISHKERWEALRKLMNQHKEALATQDRFMVSRTRIFAGLGNKGSTGQDHARAAWKLCRHPGLAADIEQALSIPLFAAHFTPISWVKLLDGSLYAVSLFRSLESNA